MNKLESLNEDKFKVLTTEELFNVNGGGYEATTNPSDCSDTGSGDQNFDLDITTINADSDPGTTMPG